MSNGKKVSRTIRSEAEIPGLVAWVESVVRRTVTVGAVAIWLGRPHDNRSLAQNAKMWAMLADIRRQTNYHGMSLTDDEWKDLFSAAVREQKVVPGLFGGVVAVGQRTSKFSKAEMSDLFELMYWFGAENGIRWSEPELVERDRELVGGQRHGTPRQLQKH